MRLLLTLIAVVAVILAILFDTPWLYLLAGLTVLGLLGLWASSAWKSHKRSAPREPASATTRDELAALGIMEIRKKEEEEEREKSEPSSTGTARPISKPRSTPEKEQSNQKKSNTAHMKGDDTAELDDEVETPDPERSTADVKANDSGVVRKQPSSVSAPRAKQSNGNEQGISAHAKPREEGVQVAEKPDEHIIDPELLDIISPYLSSLRAATDATTAALLVQNDVDLAYRVAAIASSRSGAVRPDAQFETREPLLTANLSRQAASIRLVGSDLEGENLGYYRGSQRDIQEIGLAPVSRSNHSSTFFLLIDTPEAFDWKRVQRLLARYADLLAVILNAHDSKNDDSQDADEEYIKQTDREDLPPRREIIAQEMERARAGESEMALAILYLNRAESIAAKGDKAVARAEQALHSWLEKAAPNSRVEPFGELTYGLFFNGNVEEAEQWAVNLQNRSEEAPPPIEGGVSIGLSMLRPRHQSPDALRGDATEALREAYTTGTCTILD